MTTNCREVLYLLKKTTYVVLSSHETLINVIGEQVHLSTLLHGLSIWQIEQRDIQCID